MPSPFNTRKSDAVARLRIGHLRYRTLAKYRSFYIAINIDGRLLMGLPEQVDPRCWDMGLEDLIDYE